MNRAFSMNEKYENWTLNISLKLNEKILLGRYVRRWQNNTKMDLKETV
jgi:hypothetical protein